MDVNELGESDKEFEDRVQWGSRILAEDVGLDAEEANFPGEVSDFPSVLEFSSGCGVRRLE